MRKSRRIYILLMALALALFGAVFSAAACCTDANGNAVACTGGGGGGGGFQGCDGSGTGCISSPNFGSGDPPANPYTWIEDLPLTGDTPTHSTTWCWPLNRLPTCGLFIFYWHGVSGESFGLVDASTYTMDVGQVNFAFYVQDGAQWQWDATYMATTLYGQHNTAGTYPNDPACAVISPPPPSNMEGSAGCKDVTPDQRLVGANASLYINLGTSLGSNAGPLSGNDATFLHKLYP